MSEYMFINHKVLVVGEKDVGKTSVIKSLGYDYYYPYTNIVFKNEEMKFMHDIQIYEIESNNHSIPRIHNDATEVIVVIDPLANPSYASVSRWFIGDVNAQYYLVINKYDLAGEAVYNLYDIAQIFDNAKIFVTSATKPSLNIVSTEEIVSRITYNRSILFPEYFNNTYPNFEIR